MADRDVLRQAADILDIDSLLTDTEREVQAQARAFTEEHIKPGIPEWFDRAEFPTHLIPELGSRGYFGMHLQGYGCPGKSAVEYGLAALEIEAGDSALRTLVSVQGSLAMKAIHAFGSEDQKQHYLPAMAAGDIVGCFGLTEPDSGSDPAGMKTVAARKGDGWVLNGAKRWIGLASLAQVAVVWAQTDNGVRGFLVPTDAEGFTATPLQPKLSLRASVQCDVTFTNVELPADAQLPEAKGLRAPFTCLNEARYGISWGALGAARDSFEVALDYALGREGFGKPIAAFQLTQQKLVDMAVKIQQGLLTAVHLGRLKDSGKLTPAQISLAKLSNTRDAIAIAREARTILGGNGVLLEYSPQRHANNLEAVRTYEGTDEVHTLILGRHLTRLDAFH